MFDLDHEVIQSCRRNVAQVRCQCWCSAVQESVNKLAASAASLDYVKFQAVIESAASAAVRKPAQNPAVLPGDGLAGGQWPADSITA